jgi:glyoxylase-like metal-dependent hydrolase (beta-lactamase superfamily II)
MKVKLLNKKDRIYSSNAYLVLGDWNRLEDINTLIDTGTDESILNEIENSCAGVGKKKVERLILTHNHFDHIGNLSAVKKIYQPRVYAFHEDDYVDEVLKDGQLIRIGNREVEVIHVPMHSSDSICLYCREEGLLFSGDTPLRIMSVGGTYPKEFVRIIERLNKLDIRMIYSGHDVPTKKGIKGMLENTMKNVKTSSLFSFL